MTFSSVQLNPLTDWVVAGPRGTIQQEIVFLSFSTGGRCEQFRHERGCPLFDVVHPTFPLPTTASPVLRGALKDGFGEAVMACE